MRNTLKRKLWRLVCFCCYWGALILGGAVAGLGRIELNSIDKSWEWLVLPMATFSRARAWWFVPICLIVAPVASAFLAASKHGNVDRLLKKLLNEFRNKAFPPKASYLDYRVTLFTYRDWYFGRLGLEVLLKAVLSPRHRWRWPWRGWLVPYERAGEYHLNPRTYFYAPKADVDAAEGFAGAAFKHIGIRSVENLPIVEQDGKNAVLYAGQTGVTERDVMSIISRGKVLPRSFWGTAIEVDSHTWGVVLIDCRVPTLPDGLAETFTPFGMCLSKLLSRKSE